MGSQVGTQPQVERQQSQIEYCLLHSSEGTSLEGACSFRGCSGVLVPVLSFQLLMREFKNGFVITDLCKIFVLQFIFCQVRINFAQDFHYHCMMIIIIIESFCNAIFKGSN